MFCLHVFARVNPINLMYISSRLLFLCQQFSSTKEITRTTFNCQHQNEIIQKAVQIGSKMTMLMSTCHVELGRKPAGTELPDAASHSEHFSPVPGSCVEVAWRLVARNRGKQLKPTYNWTDLWLETHVNLFRAQKCDCFQRENHEKSLKI